MKLNLAVAALSLVAAVHSPWAAEVEASQNATVQPGGIRTGGSGINFFNVEGSSFGSFASYAVARFDIGMLKAGFDTQYGIGGWRLDSVALQLTQSNASFTAAGDVQVLFTADDSVSLVAPSPLTHPFAGDFPDALPLLSYRFTEVASGSTETHGLYSRSGGNLAGGMALAAHIGTSDLVTLALVEGDAGVAATYAGYNNSSYAGPTLAINVSAVPEADAVALMLAGLGGVMLIARRRGGRAC